MSTILHGNDQLDGSSMQAEGIKHHALYPPVIEAVEKLGYVKDGDNRVKSRDIGRSFVIGGRYYYIFGDTFCKNEQGLFIDLQTNSVAKPSKGNPLLTRGLGIKPDDGMVDYLIPRDDEEKGIEKNKLPLGEMFRIKLWCFGGVAVTSPEMGWLWYEKSVKKGEVEVQYYGVGVARVCVDKNTGLLDVTRIDSHILSNPGGSDMIFKPEEPRIGSFSVLVEGDFIYLWGTFKKDIVLARVPSHQPHVRNAYRFWNGTEYVEDIANVKPLMYGMQQGAVFESRLFGKDKPWVVVGCTCWQDSMIMVGAAPSIEGPWELIPVAKAEGIIEWHLPQYCMYPHTWLFDEEKGELGLTWCERWPGNVIMAKLKFKMRSTHWRKVSLSDYSASIEQWIVPHMRSDSIVSEGKVTLQRVSAGITDKGTWVPVHLHVEGEDEGDVKAVTAVIDHRLSIKSFEEGKVKIEAKSRKRSSKEKCVLKVMYRRLSR